MPTLWDEIQRVRAEAQVAPDASPDADHLRSLLLDWASLRFWPGLPECGIGSGLLRWSEWVKGAAAADLEEALNVAYALNLPAGGPVDTPRAHELRRHLNRWAGTRGYPELLACGIGEGGEAWSVWMQRADEEALETAWAIAEALDVPELPEPAGYRAWLESSDVADGVA